MQFPRWDLHMKQKEQTRRFKICLPNTFLTKAHIKDKPTSTSTTQCHTKFLSTPGHKDGNSDGE